MPSRAWAAAAGCSAVAAVADVVALRERGSAAGDLFGAVFHLVEIGPPIGGFPPPISPWRWIFYVNLPLGSAASRSPALGAVARCRYLERVQHSIDYLGATLHLAVRLSAMALPPRRSVAIRTGGHRPRSSGSAACSPAWARILAFLGQQTPRSEPDHRRTRLSPATRCSPSPSAIGFADRVRAVRRVDLSAALPAGRPRLPPA